jgi:hypothetical protein
VLEDLMTGSVCRSTLLVLAVLLTMPACRDVPTGITDPLGPDFKPAPSRPSYTVLTPAVAPGWTAFMPANVNSLHQAVGVMNPVGNTSQMAARAAYWVAGGTAVPEVLPVFPGMTWSQAGAISENGIVGGRIFPAAVLWKRGPAGWEPSQLAAWGIVNGVRDDGSAVGTMWDPERNGDSPPQPVMWDAAGTPDTLPLPSAGPWNAGEALAVNAQGDVAGTLVIWTLGMSTIYGALWIREGEGYTPLVMQTGWSRGLSDRTATGSIYVTASGAHDAYRHRFTRNVSGVWTSDSVYVEGVAHRMNPAGDFVGALEKGRFGSSPKPYVFPATGSVLTLPLAKNASGSAVGISADGWITGYVDGVGVVWKPGS